MLDLVAIVTILALGSAALLIRQVERDFFAAVAAEYDRQLSRDPGYRKRMKERRRPMREKLQRRLRRAVWRLKMLLYPLAVALGLRQRRDGA